jgi:Transposase IS116/IS110/IS902 family
MSKLVNGFDASIVEEKASKVGPAKIDLLRNPKILEAIVPYEFALHITDVYFSKEEAHEGDTRQIPAIGPIRAALLVALLQTPHRFRTKRQLWAYSGFALEPSPIATFALVPAASCV